MAPTQVGEDVLDLVIPYIHNIQDRNSISLVSRKFYEVDGITRKRLTVHTFYYPNPASLSKRFPFIESLTLKGPPSIFNVTDDYATNCTLWIKQLALEFRCLKELHIRCMVVHDEDLETLATTRGKDLRSLKIKTCKGFSTDGLLHVSKYCNQLRTLCLGYYYEIHVKDGIWLHQLALNSMVLERLHVWITDISSAEDLTLLAKNCCNSLISLKIGDCSLSKLGDAFRYAVRLEHFGGVIWDEDSELVGFRFPPNIHSLSRMELPKTQFSILLPLLNLNQIKKFKLFYEDLDEASQCLLFKRCANLEILDTKDVSGDRGLQVIGKFCKKLRKLTYNGVVTHVGLIALAKGCINLEALTICLGDISNEALECLGTNLKNLCDFWILVHKEDNIIDLPLDNGVRAMLMGCSKLEKLNIRLMGRGLTDMGLEYIGKYGTNLRSLSLTLKGNSIAGLVKLSKGCPRLRKLSLWDCPFRTQVVTSIVFNIPSLRYVWVLAADYDSNVLAFIRPEFQR